MPGTAQEAAFSEGFCPADRGRLSRADGRCEVCGYRWQAVAGGGVLGFGPPGAEPPITVAAASLAADLDRLCRAVDDAEQSRDA